MREIINSDGATRIVGKTDNGNGMIGFYSNTILSPCKNRFLKEG